MKRRAFLQGGLAAGVIVALGGGGWWLARTVTPEFLLKVLGKGIQNKDDLLLIGNAYLAQVPDERSRRVISQLLAERFKGRRAFQIEEVMAETIREDFVLNDIVKLDEWILSRTELRLCALAALKMPRKIIGVKGRAFSDG